MHTDHLDTPRMLTNSVGTVVWRANYEALGKAAVDEDPDGNSQSATFNVRFPGQYFDAESGLHANYHRYFDPGVGRYISADPIGQTPADSNLYTYARNAPTRYTDPKGLYCVYSQSTGSTVCYAVSVESPPDAGTEAAPE